MALSRQDFESVYRELEVSLFNFALRWVFDPATAEEVVHEAFVKVWDKRTTVEGATLKGLLYKTVQNVALNEIRRRKVRAAIPILSWFDNSSRDPSADLIQQQELLRLQAEMEKLPFELREVLLLSRFSDMSYDQIATFLGVPAGTVASRLNRAMRILRKNFSEENAVHE